MGCFVPSDLPPLSGAQALNVALDIEQLINLLDGFRVAKRLFSPHNMAAIRRNWWSEMTSLTLLQGTGLMLHDTVRRKA